MPLRTITLLLLCTAYSAAAEPDKDGFVPLFNGKDLSGWVNVNCRKDTFFVKDGMLITTGKPTGYLRTVKHYENFIMEMEWMHMNKTAMGNSGLFVWGDPLPAVGTGYTRGIEVQVLVNFETDWATSHGDIFSIWGAKCKPDRPHPKGYERCLPSENRCKGGGEWNHYRVEAKDGVIKLHVNGKEVSGVSECNPRKGFLALESEGAECRFKNIKIKELPSSNPKANEIAHEDQGHFSVFNGLDLEGWKTGKDAWAANDGRLYSKAASAIVLDRSYGAVEFVFDWKQPAKATAAPTVTMGGVETVLVAPKDSKPGAWNRVTLKGNAAAGNITINPGGGVELRNLFIREVKK
jgi:hypothetical protein